MLQVKILEGDITRQKVDAIVNAAGPSLLGVGIVAGAVHHAAGPELLQECSTLGGCPVGAAKTTRGCRLAAPYIIHAVGTAWVDGRRGEDDLLAQCYRSYFAAVVAISSLLSLTIRSTR